jgi:hypothetical protein
MGHERWQSFDLIVCPAVVDRDVFALDITRVLEALTQCVQRLSKPFGRLRVEEPDYGHPRLLRPRRHWPRRAADHPDNLATTQLTKLHPLPR